MTESDPTGSGAASPEPQGFEKDFLHAMLDTVLDGVIAMDRTGVIRSVNHAATRVFGYRREDLVGRNVRVLMPEPHRSNHDGYLERYARTGEARIVGIPGRELEGRRSDGSTFPIELGVSKMLLEGEPLYLGVVRDITERKASEALGKQLAAINETVVDGVLTIDAVGAIVSVNPACCRLFGYSPEEMLGQNVKLLMPEPYHGAHDGYLEHYLRTGERRIIGVGREAVARRKDGSTFPIDLSVGEALLPGGRLFVGLVRDISARKAAEAETRSLVESLRISNQELDDFAYIASHDLKEPLRGLTNNALFLQEDHGDRLDADGTRRLDRMRYLCERMEALINDLLYFSRIGRQDLARRPTDLGALVEEVRQMMLTTLEEENADVVAATPLPTLICDTTRVKEALRNLIANGVKYNQSPRKRVEVGFLPKHAGRLGVVFVRDNGIGIEPRFHADIFRIFKRLNVETPATQGTGAGLTFVKKIVERHDGEVWVESALGQGSTFFFTLSGTGSAPAHESARETPYASI